MRSSDYRYTVFVDGVMAGQWKHVLRGRGATVQNAPLRPFSCAERDAAEHAAADHGRSADCRRS